MGPFVHSRLVNHLRVFGRVEGGSSKVGISLCSAVVVNLTEKEASLQYILPVVAVRITSIHAKLPGTPHLKPDGRNAEQDIE